MHVRDIEFNTYLAVHRLHSVVCCLGIQPNTAFKPTANALVSPFRPTALYSSNPYEPLFHGTYLYLLHPVYFAVANVILGRDHHSDEEVAHVELCCHQKYDSTQDTIQQYHIPCQNVFPSGSTGCGPVKKTDREDTGHGHSVDTDKAASEEHENKNPIAPVLPLGSSAANGVSHPVSTDIDWRTAFPPVSQFFSTVSKRSYPRVEDSLSNSDHTVGLEEDAFSSVPPLIVDKVDNLKGDVPGSQPTASGDPFAEYGLVHVEGEERESDDVPGMGGQEGEEDLPEQVDNLVPSLEKIEGRVQSTAADPSEGHSESSVGEPGTDAPTAWTQERKLLMLIQKAKSRSGGTSETPYLSGNTSAAVHLGNEVAAVTGRELEMDATNSVVKKKEEEVKVDGAMKEGPSNALKALLSRRRSEGQNVEVGRVVTGVGERTESPVYGERGRARSDADTVRQHLHRLLNVKKDPTGDSGLAGLPREGGVVHVVPTSSHLGVGVKGEAESTDNTPVHAGGAGNREAVGEQDVWSRAVKVSESSLPPQDTVPVVKSIESGNRWSNRITNGTVGKKEVEGAGDSPGAMARLQQMEELYKSRMDKVDEYLGVLAKSVDNVQKVCNLNLTLCITQAIARLGG